MIFSISSAAFHAIKTHLSTKVSTNADDEEKENDRKEPETNGSNELLLKMNEKTAFICVHDNRREWRMKNALWKKGNALSYSTV